MTFDEGQLRQCVLRVTPSDALTMEALESAVDQAMTQAPAVVEEVEQHYPTDGQKKVGVGQLEARAFEILTRLVSIRNEALLAMGQHRKLLAMG